MVWRLIHPFLTSWQQVAWNILCEFLGKQCFGCGCSLLLFHSKHCIGSHEYIQNCRKWDTDIKLQLLTHSGMCSDLARTVSTSLSAGEGWDQGVASWCD